MDNLEFPSQKWCNLSNHASLSHLNDQFTPWTFLNRIAPKSVIQPFFLILVLAVLLVGCKSEQKPSPNSGSTPIAPSTQSKTTPQKTQVTPTQNPQTNNGTKPINGQTLVGGQEESDYEANLEKVYFPFDSYALTARTQDKLLTMAQSMKNKPQLSIQIAGHADERGTEKYNLHLGQMRAQAVQEFLLAQGVTPQMLSAISYGEKKPALIGSNSKAWQQNRRVEFQIVDSLP